MAKAVPMPDPEEKQVVSIGEVAILAVPMDAYRKLSDLAMKRNLTVGQVLAKAIESLVGEKESSSPRLLVEGDSKGA